MLKNNKGISMVALVIMIIVMLIISGILIHEGTSTIKSAKNQSIATNMLLIQAKARTIADKADFGEGTYVGTTTDSDTCLKLGITPNDKIYTLSQEDLYAEGLEVSGDNEYVVDYETEEVYYINGVEDKAGNIYYSLTDISNLSLVE